METHTADSEFCESGVKRFGIRPDSPNDYAIALIRKKLCLTFRT